MLKKNNKLLPKKEKTETCNYHLLNIYCAAEID